ncbi:MAG: hypothetical protein MJ153_01575 [Clostridia bacterium]|nr:hypothetical protein [Clostridia bacterium]
MTDSKLGSVVLEAAIVFTLFMVLIVSVVSVIDINRTDLLMQSALEETCEKIQLLPPMQIPLQDLSSTVLNALPDTIFSNEQLKDIITVPMSGIYGINDIEEGKLGDLLLSDMFGDYISDDIANEYILLNKGSDFFLPDSINTVISINELNHYAEIRVNYSKLTIVGTIDRSIYSAIPLYGDFEMYLNGEETAVNDDDDIWSMDNFSRGLILRDKFGANLPSLFPVVDIFDGGKITSIVTIDTTAPKYSDISVLIDKISKEIDELAEFDGDEVKIDGSIYSIDGADITDRELLVIIPGNDTGLDNGMCNDIIAYGEACGVTVTIQEYGISERYSDKESVGK